MPIGDKYNFLQLFIIVYKKAFHYPVYVSKHSLLLSLKLI